MRRISLTVGLAMLAMGASASPPRERLNATLQDLQASKQTATALQQKAAVSQRQLEEMQQHAAELAERLQVSERRVSKQEAALAATNEKLAATEKMFDSRKQDYARTVMNLLRLREVPATALFTSPEDIQALMRAASVLQNTNAALAAQAAQLRQTMSSLRRLRAQANTDTAATRAQQLSLRAEQEKLNSELAKRQRAQAQLNADQHAAEAKVADLSRQSTNLQELIGKIEEDRQSRPATTKPDRRPAMAATLGSLRAPVVGTLVHRFGEHKTANETWRGVLMRTRARATVVAPADGEIVFTGPFRDYGNMVLIKHKGGIITLVAGLGQVKANLNQVVLRGEPVGAMPDDGQPEAYIELRDRESKPIDPSNGFANLDHDPA